jgi:hypothetical protein
MGRRFTHLRVRAVVALSLCGASAMIAPAAGCGSKSGLPLWDRSPLEAGSDGPIEQPLACGTFSVRGALAPLDLFIMMDTSGSMQDQTTDGNQKIQSMRKALEGFLTDPKSAGIGVTIGFFPIIDYSVPPLCATDLTCGLPGACQPLFVCYPKFEQGCATDADCGSDESCQQIGYCDGQQFELCFPASVGCSSGASCVPGGLCENHTVCDPAAYASSKPPAVLPQGAAAVISALAAHNPSGGTPTLPALQGAIQAAIENSKQSPDHKSIVLLATDGFPTSCDPAIPASPLSPAGIPKVVEAAKQGNASGVQTFVIGVFTQEEAAIAQQNLDAIADAGGSQTAYVIKTNQPVSQEVLASLNAIRTAATQCSYSLPKPGDKSLDATKLEVSLIGAGGTRVLPRVAALEDCGELGEGFVFDKDPWGPEPPALIQLCPASCQAVRADPDLDIQVKVVCAPGS